MKPSERLIARLSEAFELETDQLTALELAGAHLDTAAELDAVVSAEGVMKDSPRSGWVLHPAIAEARHQRAQAWAIIKAVLPDDVSSVDAASLGQADSGNAHRSAASVRSKKAADTRWGRARAGLDAVG